MINVVSKPKKSKLKPMVKTNHDAYHAIRVAFYITLAIIGPLAVALTGLQSIDLSTINHYGLLPALPVRYFVAFAFLSISFSWAITRHRINKLILLSYVIAFIAIIHMPIALSYDVPRYAWVYKHFGVIDFIQQFGQLDPFIDAYHNWPGFFAWTAFFFEATELDYVGLSNWAQTIFNLLYLLPLYYIARVFGEQSRFVFMSIALFYLTNWVGQDYFAPQAFAYFLYLVIIAVISVHLFEVEGEKKLISTFNERFNLAFTSSLRVSEYKNSFVKQRSLFGLIIIIFVALVMSHQLTPFAVLACVSAFYLSGSKKLGSLFILMNFILALWLAFMTQPYLSSNLTDLLSQVGQLFNNFDQSVIQRITGSVEHQVITQSQISLTLILWCLAFFGFVKEILKKRLPFTLSFLAVAPFFLMILQPYGGEAMLRLYYFTQPFMCIFAARAVLIDSKLYWLKCIYTGFLLVLMSGLLIASYFGNEGVNYVTPEEIESVEVVYALPTLDLEQTALISVGSDFPFRLNGHYYQFGHYDLIGPWGLVGSEYLQDENGLFERIVNVLAEQEESYVFLSKVQFKRLNIKYELSEALWPRLKKYLDQESAYKAIYEKNDVIIYEKK